MNLQEQVKHVAQLREEFAFVKDVKATAYNTWLVEHTDLMEAYNNKSVQLADAEALLRQSALNAYAVDGNKHPVPEITIKVFEKLTYDQQEAFKWALEHKICLKLDTNSFDKMAKMAPETRPAFVTVSQEPQAQIAQDLSHLKEF